MMNPSKGVKPVDDKDDIDIIRHYYICLGKRRRRKGGGHMHLIHWRAADRSATGTTVVASQVPVAY